MNKTDLFLSSQNSHIAGIIDIMLVVTGTLSTAKKLLEKKENSFHCFSTQFFNEDHLKIGVRRKLPSPGLVTVTSRR